MRPVLIGALLAACAAPPASHPVVASPPSIAPAELRPPVTDLSGAWATGRENEPPAGPVRQHPSCAYNPPVWIIQQTGNQLQTYDFPESYNQGIARVDRMQKTPPVPGTISGADVLVASDDVRMVLRYDQESGHLRGTRNGAPFWAARQVIIRESCPGIP